MARSIIGQTRAGGVDLVTLAASGLLKPFLEASLEPVVGDGNAVSGITKTGLALAVNQWAGRGTVQDAVSIAFAVDGIEDLMRGLLGMGGQQTDPFGGAL